MPASFSTVGLYVAPEVFKDGIFERSVDAFSFGLILYEVCLNYCSLILENMVDKGYVPKKFLCVVLQQKF